MFNDPKYLERAAGLDKYYAAADAAFTEWDDDDAGDAEADVVEEDE